MDVVVPMLMFIEAKRDALRIKYLPRLMKKCNIRLEELCCRFWKDQSSVQPYALKALHLSCDQIA